MSMAIGHFAVGTSATMVAYHTLPLRIRVKMRVAQFFIFTLGGLWAMLPDLNNFTGIMRYLNDKYWTKIKPLQRTILSDFTGIINRIEALHESKWANVFFLHRLMDIIDKKDSPLISGVFIFIMISIAAFFLIKEILEHHPNRNT